MTKLTIVRGLPASGKDTWARKQVALTLSDDKPIWIVNRDALRFMAGLGSAPTDYEKVITAQQHTLIRQGLRKGAHVISSDMNLDAKYVKALAEIAEHFGAEVVVKDMDTPLATCIDRDRKRGFAGGHTVGDEFITKTHKRFFSGGKFPRNPLINRPEPVRLEPYRPDRSKPRAKIWDVDGTLAEMNGRSPYDYTKVNTDLPHLDVIEELIHSQLSGFNNIILSGRESICRSDTISWLRKWSNLPIDMPGNSRNIPVFMRSTGDGRADFIIKYELFMQNVAPYFNVVAWYDDRNQVVDMARSIGIRVYQVNYGDF